MKKIIKNYQLEILANELIKMIKLRKDIFTPLNIVVPNNKVAEWLKTYWLKHLGDILMNVNFQSIDDALFKLIDSKTYYHLLKPEEIKVLIIKVITEDNSIELPTKIKNYIYDSEQFNSIKIYDFACELASLFIQYEKDQFQLQGWQQQLYDKVLSFAYENDQTTLSFIFNKEQQIRKTNMPIYFFGFLKFNNLQTSIIDQYSLESDLNYNKKYCITSTPSRYREIEALHSKICTLLLDKNNTYDDFLVLIPNLSKYEDVIERVFKQNNNKFPNIPYVINDYKKEESSVSTGLATLIKIANNHMFTRLDFYNLINNNDIKIAREISDEQINCWSHYLVDTNVYRNSETSDDWEYAKKRILLSKILNINDVDNCSVELNNQEYLLYSSIGFDDESIVKFVSIIDDLKEWIKITENIKYVNSENILIIENELRKWFSVLDENNFEQNNQFKNLLKHLHFWQNLNISKLDIPRNTLLYSLIDSSKAGHSKKGECFNRGITFIDFNEDIVLSTKYVFMLNLSSSEIPLQVVKSEFDERNYDIDNTRDIENAFLIQYQNANQFYVSYVSRNLKTDEEFYQSSLILKLKQRSEYDEEVLTLDETRNWSELFTENAYLNKNYYLNLLNTKEETSSSKETHKPEKVNKISLTDLARFLQEPLQNKTNYLFAYSDTLDEDMRNEYEPFSLNSLTENNLVRKLCVACLNKKIKQIDDEYLNKMKHQFNLEHKLPNLTEIINEIEIKKVQEKCSKILENIFVKTHGNYEEFNLNDIILNVDDEQYIITRKQECCVSVVASLDIKEIRYFSIKTIKDKPEIKDYLYPYVYSLVDIMSREECTYKIILDVGKEMSFYLTPKQAKEKLVSICKEKLDYTNNHAVLLNSYNNKTDISFSKYIKEIKNDWKYFDSKNLFDYETQLGFKREEFEKKYKDVFNKHFKLIAFLDSIITEGEKDGE